MYKHKLPFTVCFTAMMFIIFFYCAAEYPVFVQQFDNMNPGAPVIVPGCYDKSNSTYYGPRQMEHWIKSGVSRLRETTFAKVCACLFGYLGSRIANLSCCIGFAIDDHLGELQVSQDCTSASQAVPIPQAEHRSYVQMLLSHNGHMAQGQGSCWAAPCGFGYYSFARYLEVNCTKM